MGLSDIVSSGIAIAKTVTADLQDTVTHEAWISSEGGKGSSVYAKGETYQAIVEMKELAIRGPNDEVIMSRAKVSFLQPIPQNGAAGRREPIDPRDRITLPDGTTGPIIRTEGMVNPDTDLPFMVEVWLGRGLKG